MKKLLALSFCAAILAGCGDSIPSECETTLKEYDSIIAQASKKTDFPAAMKTQIEQARKDLVEGIKKSSKEDAIKACNVANASFAQLKQMLPKE